MKKRMDRWLQLVGFSAHPFAFYVAEKEPQLPDYFLPPVHFQEIMGKPAAPVSSVVFAGRGGGKTAQRIMARRRCSQEGRTLCLVYSDFDAAALAPSLPGHEVRNIHVMEILNLAIHDLADALLNDDRVFGRYVALPPWEKFYIHWFIHYFREGLSPYQRAMLVQAEIDPLERGDALATADLSEDIVRDLREKARFAPCVLLRLFTKLIRGLGYDALYVLVDGVDEMVSHADAASAIQIIKPMLSDFKLLNASGAVFKFFLPQEWEDEFSARLAIRQDRLPTHYLEWTPEDLMTMLRRRLKFFRGKPGLADLCEPGLGDRIELDMIRLSQGSPRNMIRLGNLLLFEHCARFNGKMRRIIPKTAWEDAKITFLSGNNLIGCIKKNDPFFPFC